MHIIDPSFKDKKFFFLGQSVLVFCFVSFVLILLGHVAEETILGAVGIGAVSASSFIVFISKNAASAPRNLIGGYTIGILTGGIMHLVYLSLLKHPILIGPIDSVFSASLSVAMASFFMSLTDCRHPPCAGLSIALTLERWDPRIIVVVSLSILVLSLIQRFVTPRYN